VANEWRRRKCLATWRASPDRGRWPRRRFARLTPVSTTTYSFSLIRLFGRLPVLFGRAQQWSGSKAVAFRLLLVVSLWRGPVLWAHEHSAACEDLSRHLSVFHADNPEAWNLGWHWHLC